MPSKLEQMDIYVYMLYIIYMYNYVYTYKSMNQLIQVGWLVLTSPRHWIASMLGRSIDLCHRCGKTEGIRSNKRHVLGETMDTFQVCSYWSCKGLHIHNDDYGKIMILIAVMIGISVLKIVVQVIVTILTLYHAILTLTYNRSSPGFT